MKQLAGMMGNGTIPSVVVGLGVAVAVPLVAGIMVPRLRPLARNTIKGGILIFEKARETAAGFTEVLGDLVAEVREELKEAKDRGLAQEGDSNAIEGEWAAEDAVANGGGRR